MKSASKPASLRSYLTLITIIATFAVNAWSNIRPINGESIGEISNTTFADVLITPANYAFVIWGLIYLGLIAFGVYQLLPRQRDRSNLDPVRNALILSSLAQIIWVFLFLFRNFWGSLAAMVVILGALLYGYVQRPTLPFRRERWFVQRPLSLYLGWISVATIVNGAIAFYSAGWTELGLGMPTWTVIMLAIATVLGGYMAIVQQDAVFSGVFVWALTAIAIRQSDTRPVQLAAIIGAGLLIIGMGIAQLLLLRRDSSSLE
jgi:hypothetical protein